MKEKIIEMLKMQEVLDNSFMQYIGKETLTPEEVRIALFDECGELCHALKAEWCYWKKSQKPVDREEVKKELSDVWHFALSLHRLENRYSFSIDKYNLAKELYNFKKDWFHMLQVVSSGNPNVLYHVIDLTERLGFTFDEIYEAYIEKNKENYERIKRGY